MSVSATEGREPIAAGAEFAVNTTTREDQFNPIIAPLTFGGYAVVWASGSSEQIGPVALYLQVFGEDGAKVGSEIVLDTSTDNFPADGVQIEALANGNYLVAWDDPSPGDGGTGTQGSYGIRAQLFSPAGTAASPAFQVNQTVNESQSQPRMAELSDGHVAVVWTQQNVDLRGRIFNSDGTASTGEFTVNVTDSGQQVLPSIAALPGGGFIVAWTDYAAGQAAGDVRAQVFSNSGAYVGSEILLDGRSGSQEHATVAALAGGNAVAVWDASGEILGQLIDAGGNKIGSPFQVNTTTAGYQSLGAVGWENEARIIALADGGFAVSWTTEDSTTRIASAQAFAADGTKVGSEIIVNSVDPNFFLLQTMEALSDGGFILGWTTAQGGYSGDWNAYIQVYDAAGSAVGAKVMVHDVSAGQQRLGDFAIGADGRLLAVWDDGLPADLVSNDPARLGMELKGRLFDTLHQQVGSDNGDLLRGTAGTDLIYGLGGDDEIHGLGGNDILVGGAGNDTLLGGPGDDTYIIDSTGDNVIEFSGEGNDRVAASVDYKLPDGSSIERLEAITLSATTPLSLTGNELANTIVGNAGDNVLDGGAGNDRVEGGAGNDILIGGTGADVMYGNAGNDVFYVDNPGDMIYETGGEGIDRVATSVDFVLTDHAAVEKLEALTLSDTAALALTGNELGQTIVGNAGTNVIDGKGGNDILVGYLGSDTFCFSTTLGPNNIDRIEDFQPGTDKIALSHSVFGYYNPGSLDPATFHVGAAAASADDHIIYDSSTGALFYDADGTGAGAQVQFATLQSGLALSAGDFMVV